MNKVFLVFAAAFFLTTCGGSDPKDARAADTKTVKTEKADTSGLNKWGKDLVKEENCHPAIAKALQPYEAEYGQCSMNTYTDICGAENFQAGVKLIKESFDQEIQMVNPWGLACARTGDTRAALISGCMERFRQSEDVCGCAADKTIAAEDPPLAAVMSLTDNSDTPEALRRFPEYLGILGAKAAGGVDEGTMKRQMDVQKARQRHYGRIEACRG